MKLYLFIVALLRTLDLVTPALSPSDVNAYIIKIMESRNLTNNINPIYLLASIALGTIGAAALNVLKNKKHQIHDYEDTGSGRESLLQSPVKK